MSSRQLQLGSSEPSRRAVPRHAAGADLLAGCPPCPAAPAPAPTWHLLLTRASPCCSSRSSDTLR